MSMKLKPYPEYQDSGLPWLRDVPVHWEILRSKYIFREVDERSQNGEETHLSMSQKYGLIESSKIDDWRLQSESYAGGKLCKTNDLVLNRLKAHLGVFSRTPIDGVVSPDYTVFRLVRNSEVRYFEFVYKTPIYITELKRSTKGIVEGFWRLYTDDFNDIRVPFPPTDEQKVILSWIDQFNNLVHRFIRNKRRLIEALNEQKQAIINRAVMRGVNSDINLKPSGFDWLGDMPEHWVTKPLKRWVKINSRVLPETTDPNYTFKYLDIGAVGTGLLAEQPETMKFDEAPSRARRILTQGDTIISTVRTYLKAVYFVENNCEDLIASTGFAVLTPGSGVVPEYLGYVIRSNSFIERVTANSIGIAYPAISESRLGVFHLALPPTELEQRAIIKHIKTETQAMDDAIKRTQREIDFIQEYRTRLIADVVTGKLDVRDVKLSTVDEMVTLDNPLVGNRVEEGAYAND